MEKVIENDQAIEKQKYCLQEEVVFILNEVIKPDLTHVPINTEVVIIILHQYQEEEEKQKKTCIIMEIVTNTDKMRIMLGMDVVLVKVNEREIVNKQKMEKEILTNENFIEFGKQILKKDQSEFIHKYVEEQMEQNMNVSEMIQMEKKKDHGGMINMTKDVVIDQNIVMRDEHLQLIC
ncbi:MAG: hypothetical protein EZS28_036771 [Streblomastix strix]|uniref:Uncharacterized protein n=1 Tax=Streblomastix strix TaxID=222440 RepID=A0A5J4UCW5_9EUKA|nr:MAG: hypothetical protein EZS28_036771 [Streblomastix strix]